MLSHMWRTAGPAVLLGACLGNSATEFPPGLEPLEDNTAPAQAAGAISEQLALINGDAGYLFVHGRGYLTVPPAAVWSAIQDAELLSSSCRIDSWSVTEHIDLAYTYSFLVHNEVDDLVTVAWDEEWRFGVVLGTEAAPKLGMVRYQKTYGSDFISLLEGSIQVLATERPDVTELQFIEHLDAVGGGHSDLRSSMQRRFDSLQAVVRGGTPPACP